ncbi:MAG TPA: MFS transporter [Solirubrobacterales bacterium]|jgi:MFS family permease
MDADPVPSHGLAAYRRVLAAPGVRAAAIASVLARIPVGFGAVALVLYVHHETGSFAAAGATAGAFTIGLALTGPLLARTIDRRGPRTVLMPCAAAGSAALAAVVGLGSAGAGTVPLALAAGVAGMGMPPLGGVLRQRWPELVSPGDLPSAFALDSVLIEAIFISGPLLAGLMAATIGTGAGLLVGAALGAIGTLWFAALPVSRGDGHPAARERGRAGVLSSPPLRLLILAGVPIGGTFGALDVALPAFGVVHGSSALGGPCAAALGLGSAAGGIFYGARPDRLGGPLRAFDRLRGLQVLTCLPLLLAPSVPAMLVLAALAGVSIAPLVTVRNQLAHEVAPAGTATEAFSWLSLSVMIGTAAGSALAGPLVQAGGWRLGVCLAFMLPALGLLQLLPHGARLRLESEPPETESA